MDTTTSERGALRYTMDVEGRSTWLRTTPGAEERQLPFLVSEAGAFYARSRFTTERAHKEAYLVFYTLGGAGVVEQGGKSVRLERGQALLMDCREPQRYFTAPDRHHWYHLWMHVNGAGMPALAEALGCSTLMPVSLPLSDVSPRFDEVFEALESPERIAPLRAGLAAHSLLVSMAQAMGTPATEAERTAVQVARERIESRYRENVTLDDLASVACVSPSYLIRLFRDQLGTTPYNYLLRYRITRAKELLAETAMPIDQIARETGFSSASNFSYRFRKMEGQSPSSYRAGTPELFPEPVDGDGQ